MHGEVSPRLEIEPEIVKPVHLCDVRLVAAELRHGVPHAPSRVALEHRPEGVVETLRLVHFFGHLVVELQRRVVLLALGGVRQDLVGLLDLDEELVPLGEAVLLLFRRVVVLLIWMVFQRQLPILLFDLVDGSGLGDLEEGIQVLPFQQRVQLKRARTLVATVLPLFLLPGGVASCIPVVVLLLRLLHVAVVVHAAPLDRLLHGHAQHAVLLARFDVVAVEPAPVRDDHVLRFRALDFLAAREGEVRAGRQADVQLGAGVQDLHADLIHLVHRLQARIRPRVAHLLGELVRGPVDVHVRRQEIHGEAETGEQRLVHRLSPLLIDAHPHGDRLGQVHLLVGALLPLSPDDEHVVYVQNLRVHPHLDDADGPAQIAEDDIQGRAHRDMHLVVQLGEGLGGELGHVDAVFVQQAHELVLLAVDDGLPAPRRLADLELLPLRQADALELLVGLVLDVDDYVVRLVRRHDPRDGLGCGALLLEPVAVVVDVEAQSLHPRGDA
mmetsp:Transcript_64513/g.197390  ORF Transcript_64513/g.197390 Transcript_64513/m.197390 type:complete len:497 (-) Transcript_64513:1145-2635(-)